MLGIMTNETVSGYAAIYESPEDVDLWSAGISERPLPGSMVRFNQSFKEIIIKKYINS